jgi:tetratricopeptide (TPR) repeat protein
MFLTLLLLAAPIPGQDPDAQFTQCINLATSDPAKAITTAQAWKAKDGGYKAQQCLALAYYSQDRFDGAAAAFEEAAKMADTTKDPHGADLWAQAGNGWLVAGDPAKAMAALNTALDSGNLAGVGLGEAQMDRARARVAGGDLSGARDDLDEALANAPDDPLGWLLSATLARRMDNLPRAAKDITQALRLSPDDPAVHLEEGNIAGWAGEDVAARAAFARVIELAPGTPLADQARKGLDKLGSGQH